MTNEEGITSSPTNNTMITTPPTMNDVLVFLERVNVTFLKFLTLYNLPNSLYGLRKRVITLNELNVPLDPVTITAFQGFQQHYDTLVTNKKRKFKHHMLTTLTNTTEISSEQETVSEAIVIASTTDCDHVENERVALQRSIHQLEVDLMRLGREVNKAQKMLILHQKSLLQLTTTLPTTLVKIE